jgi:hypothetical protein
MLKHKEKRLAECQNGSAVIKDLIEAEKSSTIANGEGIRFGIVEQLMSVKAWYEMQAERFEKEKQRGEK